MRSWLLTSSTITYVIAAALTLFALSQSGSAYDESDTTAMDGDRNESSTPRSFILPASPAVALEQERRAALGSQAACLSKLRAAGIDVIDEASLMESKVIGELRLFQKSRGLRVTGLLDVQTSRVIGC